MFIQKLLTTIINKIKKSIIEHFLKKQKIRNSQILKQEKL